MTSQKKLALTSFILVALTLSGCEWHDSLYKQFVSDDGKVVVCENLSYIDLTNYLEDNPEEIRCYHTKQDMENAKCDDSITCLFADFSELSDSDNDLKIKNANKDCNKVIDSFIYKLCPQNYRCLDEHDAVITMQNSEKVVHCGKKNTITEQIITCTDSQIECKDSEDNVTDCVTPDARTTCGAKCEEGKGTSGKECKEYQSCIPNGESYECGCPANTEDIDGNCIDTNTNKDYCGPQKEACKDAQTCEHGKCKCPTGSFLCDDKCVFPSNINYCGISEDCSDNRSYENCQNRNIDNKIYDCEIQNDKYSCILKDCKEGYSLCNDKCIPKNDTSNCGQCGVDCTEQDRLFAKSDKCILDNGKYACEYKCTIGLENCGSPTAPVCVDTNSNINHCGTCKRSCQSNQRCEQGNCVYTDCDGCYVEGVGCVNTNLKCGRSCNNCEVNSQTCNTQTGQCSVKSCSKGEHIRYDSNGGANCEKNSQTACAPNNNISNDEITDCTIIQNVSETNCSNEGTCEIKSCKIGHLYNNTCELDSETHCNNHNNNCYDIIPNSEQVECKGSCQVTLCKAGYHIYNNTCEIDNIEHCGEHDIKCNTGPNIKNAYCDDKKCTYEYNVTCKNDEIINSQGVCLAKCCQTVQGADYILETNQCGSTSNACVVNKCANGYTPSNYQLNANRTCMPSSCNRDGDCQYEHGKGKCGGAPKHCTLASCDSGFVNFYGSCVCPYGYYLKDNQCKPITGEHCGSDGNNCTDGKICKLISDGSRCEATSNPGNYEQYSNKAYYVKSCKIPGWSYNNNNCLIDGKLGRCVDGVCKCDANDSRCQ